MGRRARYTGHGGSEGDHRLHQPKQGVLCSRAGNTGNRGWVGELNIQYGGWEGELEIQVMEGGKAS